jgi:hypothetical protein
MNNFARRGITLSLLLLAQSTIPLSALSVRAQELSFSEKLNAAQTTCLRRLLNVTWTAQFRREMMEIGQVGTALLNNEGRPDYVFLFEADGWCGTAGCPLLIGELERGGACHLLYDGMGDKSFTVLRRLDHGYRRIYAPCEARFDGQQFQQLHEDCPNPDVPR